MQPLATRYKTALAGLLARPVVVARRFGGRDAELQTTRRGIRWQLDLREGIDFAIWLLGSFEPGTRRAYTKLVQPGAGVIDVGANVGAHTLQFASLVAPGGRVLAVEPTAFAFRKLLQNLSLNADLASNVDAVQAALLAASDDELPTELYSSWPLRSGDDLHRKHRGRAQATAGAIVSTLDALVEERNFGKVDLIKIDVDGHECDVLRGGLNTLAASRPTILMELSPYVLAEAGGGVSELIALLDESKYRLRGLGSPKPLPMEPERLEELVGSEGSINILAIPAAASGRISA